MWWSPDACSKQTEKVCSPRLHRARRPVSGGRALRQLISESVSHHSMRHDKICYYVSTIACMRIPLASLYLLKRFSCIVVRNWIRSFLFSICIRFNRYLANLSLAFESPRLLRSVSHARARLTCASMTAWRRLCRVRKSSPACLLAQPSRERRRTGHVPILHRGRISK